MNNKALALAAMGVGLWCATAQAQTAPAASLDPMAPVGLTAGSVMVRARIIGVIPEDNSSSVSAIGGKVSVTATPAPEVDLSYFFTDSISAELIAASTRHQVSATNTVLGKVDVGSAYVLPPTLTAQYHFLPGSAFRPYLGLGVTVAFFYDTQPATPTVTKFNLSTAVGPALDAGFDYNFSGHWFANFDVKQIFLTTDSHIDGGVIKAKTHLDPLVVGAGLGYRF